MADGIFLFFSHPEQIAEKIKSFSHGEFNKNQFTDIKKLKKK